MSLGIYYEKVIQCSLYKLVGDYRIAYSKYMSQKCLKHDAKFKKILKICKQNVNGAMH